MAVESVNDLLLGDVIQFKTLNPHDNIVWTGKIAAFCNYDVARRFSDVDSFYQEVKRNHSYIPDKEVLNYLLLEVTQTDASIVTIVAAKEWIDPSTLEKVSGNTHTDIRIYNIDMNKAQDILSYIRTAYPNYNAEILV